MAAVVPISDKLSSTVVHAIEYCMLPFLVGVPRKLLSDIGPECKSQPIEDFLKKYAISHIFTSPYRPG